MNTNNYILLGITLVFFVLIYVGNAYIKYLHSKRHNTELWGTIFEGITHKLVNLDAIKKPEIFIEKKAKRNGLRKDGEKDDPENEKSANDT